MRRQLAWLNVLAVSQLGDLVTTLRGIHAGTHEANPFARVALDMYPQGLGIAAGKVMTIVLLLALIWLTRRWHPACRRLVTVAVVVFALAVCWLPVWNAFQIGLASL